ncbi:MAG: NAD(P)/FAD-dependent oxidoreductase [Defluviitaleaceae bacterium]|nr:NAD(P)/FAD-dependent oxidoreductase [Defluviitaleaceae bacterium]
MERIDDDMFDVVIIGCGIVGAAAAYELSKYELSVAVLERENDVGASGATKANSAVIHAGYDPEPGTLMARLNVEGARHAKQLFHDLDISHVQCGSLVLAFSADDEAALEELLRQGRRNGLDDMRILTREETLAAEPNVSKSVTAALLAPSAMIVNPWEYTLALAETAIRNGAQVRLDSGVTAITKIDGGYAICTARGEVTARCVVNAAGLYADTIHNMVFEPEFKILPDRGEYFLLDKSEGERVSHVVFQCPNEHGKGVLVAPTVHGNLIVGPSNEPPGDIENVSTTQAKMAYIKDVARLSVPSIDFGANIRSFAGSRAKSDHGDFIIAHAKGAKDFINLAGIKSPGLSAAPAIAVMAAELVAEALPPFPRKQGFTATRTRVKFAHLDASQRAELVARDPAYGHIICRCELVTEGEVRDALNAPIPPVSLDGVKRRTGTGMGRCQGGFCGPRLFEILAEFHGCDLTEVLADGEGAYVLSSQTKIGSAKGGQAL